MCFATIGPVNVSHGQKTARFRYGERSVAERRPSPRLEALVVLAFIIDFELKKGPAPPPLGNFADISYLKENFKPHLLRDVCTLCSGALVSDSLLHMLL